MAKRTKARTGVTDQLKEYLQELPIDQALGSSDRRSLSRVQRLEQRLSGSAPAADIARELGVPTQKWVALRKRIRSGDASTSALGDLLEVTRREVAGVPELRRIEYVQDVPHQGRRKRTGEIWEITSPAWVKRNAPWMRDLKPGGFMDEKSAMNWWGNAGAGSQYFALVRQKYGRSYRYHIYDMRTPAELSEKGEVGGQQQLTFMDVVDDETDDEE